MNPGEVVGAIKTDRKPRVARTFKDRVDAKDKQIERAVRVAQSLARRAERAQQRVLVLTQRRASMVAEAKAALQEVEGIKP